MTTKQAWIINSITICTMILNVIAIIGYHHR